MWTPMRLCAAAAPAVILAAMGCASTPQPTADLAKAHTLVQQAEQSDAQQFASADLESARSKMREADADAQSQPEVSLRLAQESSVDAELALARTSAAKANQAVQQVDAGNATLRQETERAPTVEPAGAAVTTPLPAYPTTPPPPPPLPAYPTTPPPPPPGAEPSGL